ncbi:ferric uptake regulator, Fur family [Thermocrinis albus DSM 14484]|uniref:Ferric uptake regulator, Fur family n=1 Tax=Thermocrinis albus (strain DSM 14484 / JCM 11386 / HI 11/12) TaxID=638303 RepID=D3SLY8_THEAH|nr:Fur family transcriptional regulator [Thermocrinis albus]ADC89768.1 ferric uptake regulator, Fur family [Thermocrinis albus DSM 14484]
MVTDVQERLDEFVKACKSIGLKITPQRLAVYEVLLRRTDHPTVEEVYEEVRKLYPFVSLATVYRTVETLEELGFISKVPYWGGSARYDANTSHHHHLICTVCGAIADVDLNINWEPPAYMKGYQVHRFSINIYGVCPKCQNSKT